MRDKGGTVREGDYNFSYGKGNKNHELGTGFFVHHRTVSHVISGSLSPQHGASSGCGWKNGL